ncbi:integrase [Marivita lacus]|uniref:Integrase n=1 Tax=Marivita lacus TaxID=1323742 RepID=A0ABQ1LFG6_9RHOB|nr:tyrosine-type recombinase/integrase [Marivita lacus]GGC23929.1 integrase [Marivita lacus]
MENNWRSVFQRLDGAYAASTMRSYRADVEAFETWCHKEGLVAPFPAEAETLCQFLEDQAQTKAHSTIKRRLCAIRLVHRLLELPDPTGFPDVELTLRRVRRQKPGRPKQAKGLTKDYLERFLDAQPDTPWGLRNRAMLALGYELLTRRSELVSLRTDDLDLRSDGTFRVLIRRSKVDQNGLGRIAFTSRKTAELVTEWLAWRGEDIQPLFCPIYHGCPIDRALEATIVKSIIKDAAREAGLDPSEVAAFSGHSMRVGAAQDLLERGVDTAAIMRAGGWKSVNILARYLEKAEHNVWA